ncbi:MAG TPA: histidine phosphatase family protein [Longimicrobium sp.]|nr:histidine phosphatase family protein [Longimicrobium sp.]
MQRTSRLLPLFLFLLAFAVPAWAQQAAPTVVIVVRHAERDQGNDPGLTAAGSARAQALAADLKDAGVAAIYSTQFRRTVDTGKPLADALGQQVNVLPIDPAQAAAYPAALAADILAKHRGHTVVVVGHSNTVPQIVKALSGVTVPEISDTEYDHMFIVMIPAQGQARVVRAMYGVPQTGGAHTHP